MAQVGGGEEGGSLRRTWVDTGGHARVSVGAGGHGEKVATGDQVAWWVGVGGGWVEAQWALVSTVGGVGGHGWAWVDTAFVDAVCVGVHGWAWVDTTWTRHVGGGGEGWGGGG